MKIDPAAIVEFFIGTIFLKYIVAHWVAEKCMDIIKAILLKTRYEAILWIHFSEGAMERGHKARTPHECKDGYCKLIKKKP